MSVIGGRDLDFVDLPGRRSANPLGAVLSEASLRIVELERTEDRTAHRHPFSEEIVYVAARGFTLDGVRDIVRPVAMTGSVLDVEAHIVTTAELPW